MDYNLFYNLFSGIVGSLIGAGSAVWITNKINKRGILVEFMSDSYRKIALSVQRVLTDPKNREFADGLEEAIAIVQFYGTPQQVKYAHEFLEDYEKLREDNLRKGSLDKLLTDLRKENRKELGLKEISLPIKWFRIQGGALPNV